MEVSSKWRTGVCDFTALKCCSKLGFAKSLYIYLTDRHKEVLDSRFTYKNKDEKGELHLLKQDKKYIILLFSYVWMKKGLQWPIFNKKACGLLAIGSTCFL